MNYWLLGVCVQFLLETWFFPTVSHHHISKQPWESSHAGPPFNVHLVTGHKPEAPVELRTPMKNHPTRIQASILNHLTSQFDTYAPIKASPTGHSKEVTNRSSSANGWPVPRSPGLPCFSVSWRAGRLQIVNDLGGCSRVSEQIKLSYVILLN